MGLDLKKHWNEIYQSKSDSELGWYESDGSTTLEFLQGISLEGKKIFLPGAGTTKLIPQLLEDNSQIIASDISDAALTQISQQWPELNREPHQVFQLDLGSELNSAKNQIPKVDIWIDRAVLHFLTEDQQVKNYFQRLKNSCSSGSYVLLAEFAYGGALKCATLPVRHYSTKDYQRELGLEFKLIKEMPYTFINPRGEDRLYQFALFQAK